MSLVGVGALMPEVLTAAERLTATGVRAGVVCLTSPDLVFRSFQQLGTRASAARSGIVDELFPAHAPAPLVTVQDGHPHTLSFLAGVRGDRIRTLGVTEFGLMGANRARPAFGTTAAARPQVEQRKPFAPNDSSRERSATAFAR